AQLACFHCTTILILASEPTEAICAILSRLSGWRLFAAFIKTRMVQNGRPAWCAFCVQAARPVPGPGPGLPPPPPPPPPQPESDAPRMPTSPARTDRRRKGIREDIGQTLLQVSSRASITYGGFSRNGRKGRAATQERDRRNSRKKAARPLNWRG